MRFFPRYGFQLLIAAGFALAGATVSIANDVLPIDIRRPVAMDGAQRTYWIGTGASDEDAVALREALVAAGARNVNLFVPDMVIVCETPRSAAIAVAQVASSSFYALDERSVRSTAAVDPSWSWIVESYTLAERVASGQGAPASEDPNDPHAFRDVLLTIPPDRVEAIQREVELSSRMRDVAGTRPAITRRINQNSEFLGGYILANFIYPESNGVRETNSENWTDDDLRQAKSGATSAFLSWQGKFPNMDIGFVIHHFERIDTGYEPIRHDMDSDHLWIVDTMHEMGYGEFSDEQHPVVHEFNETERVKWRTQWVVTSFIANARNTPDHRFKSGTAPYTAYAYLGGPFMIEPFPAGTDPNHVGETLVFSQIANHEIGHLFYTLDEYPSSPGVCSNRSGYLNVSNGNQTMTDPSGNEGRCTPLVPCIMHSAARFNQNRPWCDYSQGHLGVLDGNGNAVPDIFEAEPEITFVPEGPETVTTNTYTMRFKAKARAVPNQNPNQGSERVSYSLPLDDGKLVLGAVQIGLDPLDGSWDEIEEEATFGMQIPQAGQHIILTVQVENNAGFKSPLATKVVYFAGVRFESVLAIPKWNRIDVNWQTVGQTFGAVYDVYRLEKGESGPGERIVRGIRSVENNSQGVANYQVQDFDVQAGTEYRYYVEGVFDLPYEGGSREYRSKSKVVGQTAMVQVVDVVSNVTPNPTRGSVTFSVSVPPSFNETSRGPSRIPTDLDIAVFNVRGQLVRALKRS
ncbi:MAG TPA: hypothetical protein VFU38_07315, partial [Candidatus Krumholzibacteria bacterium]|nr:hypothetical protein [Candidatus Krumholzibacteria bacterium]